jgi:hypothetical protein
MPVCLLVVLIVSCGGGGGGAPTTTVTAAQPTSANTSASTAEVVSQEDRLPHCIATTGTAFVNTTADVGLCFELQLDSPDGPGNKWNHDAAGIAVADIDNDGRLELYASYGRNTKGQLYSFDGSGFIRLADNNGIAPSRIDYSGYFIDLDADGWQDFISIQYQRVEVFRNDRTGNFERDELSGIFHDRDTYSMAAADYDLDGYIDLFFAHWRVAWRDDELLTQYLWRNNRDGTFVDMSLDVPIRPTVDQTGIPYEHSMTPTFADIDSDGDPDVLLAGDFESSQVLLNSSGVFSDITASLTDQGGMGSAVADFDRDGDLDWFVSSIFDPDRTLNGAILTGNRLYRNDGTGLFEDVSEAAGVRDGGWGWGSCFADFDNDGHVDLFNTNGFLLLERFIADQSRLFMSNGDGTFTEQAETMGINHSEQGRGAVCTDFDNDGRIDILIANSGLSPSIFHNRQQSANHWLQVDLQGAATNPDAIGARVVITSLSGTQTQEVVLGTGYLAQAPQTLHFGLGSDTLVSAIEVRWPDGLMSRYENIAVDRRIDYSHPANP